jgi:hypothetical protein
MAYPQRLLFETSTDMSTNLEPGISSTIPEARNPRFEVDNVIDNVIDLESGI